MQKSFKLQIIRGKSRRSNGKFASRIEKNAILVLFFLITGLTAIMPMTVSKPTAMFSQPEQLLKVEQAKAKEIEPPVATPAPQGSKEEKKEYIRKVFGEVEGNRAIVMLETCENSTLGQERTNKNRNGTVDYGVFQINSIHEKKHGPAFKTDWKANVQVAKAIHDDWKGFGAWTCGYKIGERTYLNVMRGEK